MEPTPGDLADHPPATDAEFVHPALLLMAADRWVLVEVRDDALPEL